MNFFFDCIGEKYTPVQYGKHEGIHPVRVREALEVLKGTKEADIMVALIFEVEILRQRSQRFAAEIIEKNQLLQKGEENITNK